MQGWERVVNTLSVQRPQPHNTKTWKEKTETENCRRHKRERAARPIKGIGSALETRQSHTIEHSYQDHSRETLRWE